MYYAPGNTGGHNWGGDFSDLWKSPPASYIYADEFGRDVPIPDADPLKLQKSLFKSVMPAEMWPRLTQLIELDKRAGLIDALLDFDIDAAACMWDGRNVVALPRAIQALASKTLLCRPGILQHSRNRARLSKYGRRGFSSRLLDPLCRMNMQDDGKY